MSHGIYGTTGTSFARLLIADIAPGGTLYFTCRAAADKPADKQAESAMPAGGWSEQGTPPPTTALQPTALLARLYSLCSVDFLLRPSAPTSASAPCSAPRRWPACPARPSPPAAPPASRRSTSTAARLTNSSCSSRRAAARGLPWPDRNDPARAARGRRVGSGLVKADLCGGIHRTRPVRQMFESHLWQRQQDAVGGHQFATIRVVLMVDRRVRALSARPRGIPPPNPAQQRARPQEGRHRLRA